MLNAKLKTIITALSQNKESNIFNSICLALEHAIAAEFVFIAKVNESCTQAQTISVVNQGKVVDNFSYDLAGTPCEKVRSSGVCTYTNNVQCAFPGDELLKQMDISGYVGVPLSIDSESTNALLVALYTQPIALKEEVENLFLLFSGFLEKELVKQEYVSELELIHSIAESSNEAIMICDEQQKIIYVNQAFCRITQYSREEVYGKPPSILHSSPKDRAFYSNIQRHLNVDSHWSGEVMQKRRNGEVFPEWLSINTAYDKTGHIARYIYQFTDITEQKSVAQKLYYQANFDALTNLANRNLLLSNIEQEMNVGAPEEMFSALVMFDIDYFRNINLMYNNQVGDQLLQQVATRLEQSLNTFNTIARLGSDNFAVYCARLESKTFLREKIDKILRIFEQPFEIEQVKIFASVSIGVATTHHAKSPEALFLNAEQARFVAKDKAGSSFQYFSQEIEQENDRQNQLKEALTVAIETGDIDVSFQPILSTMSYRVTKLEALARWQYQGQFVSPEIFIEIAEKHGLVAKLGEVVLRKSCQLLERLHQLGCSDVMICVNRSVYEFPEQDQVGVAWFDIIDQYQIDPTKVCFELTESILATDFSNCLSILNEAKQQGCAIAIDDFGTGYSSLSYLKSFKADVLKIDKSFVQDLFTSNESDVLVESIISMAKALKMKTVAEGVETVQQANYLINMGCDFLQGYYIAKPISQDLIVSYMMEKALLPYVDKFMPKQLNKQDFDFTNKSHRLPLADFKITDSLLDNVNAYIYVKDLRGVYTYVNQKVAQLFCASKEDIIGKDDSAFIDLSRSESLVKNDHLVYQFGNTINVDEANYIKSLGQVKTYKTTKSPFYDEQKNIIGLYGISHDISAEIKLHDEIRTQKQLLDIVLDTVDAYIYIKDADRNFLYVNNKVAKLFGYEQQYIVGKKDTQVLNEATAEHFWQSDKVVFETNKKSLSHEVLKDKEQGDLHYQSVKIPFKQDNGNQALIGFSTDVTELYNLKESIKKFATCDHLTSLYNRRYFEKIAQEAFNQAKRYHTGLSMIYIDIDHFKVINDTYGHAVGDEVLLQVSKNLLLSVREQDVVARMGGEEFSILLPDTSVEEARVIAERIRLFQAQTPIYGSWGEDIFITLSLGVTSLKPSFIAVEDMCKLADKALYRGKDCGRNTTICL